jgi:hypothetical protein
LYPAKQLPEQKIDAAVALMMAVGRAMAEEPEPDITNFLRDPIFGGCSCGGRIATCEDATANRL